MRPGAPRAAAAGEPCPASITAFWTCPLSDQGRDLRGILALSQTTAPNMPGAQRGLPPPACSASQALEESQFALRRWGGGEWVWLGRGGAGPQSDFLCTLTLTLSWDSGHAVLPHLLL